MAYGFGSSVYFVILQTPVVLVLVMNSHSTSNDNANNHDKHAARAHSLSGRRGRLQNGRSLTSLTQYNIT